MLYPLSYGRKSIAKWLVYCNLPVFPFGAVVISRLFLRADMCVELGVEAELRGRPAAEFEVEGPTVRTPGPISPRAAAELA